MYSNSATAGNWEGYVAEDLVAYMDGHYRTHSHAREPRTRRSLDGRLRHAADRDEAPRRVQRHLRAQFLLPERGHRASAARRGALGRRVDQVDRGGARQSRRAGHARSRRGLGAESGQPAALPRPADQRRRGPAPGRREMGGELTRRDARSVRAQPEEVQGDRDGRRAPGQPHHQQSRVRRGADPLRASRTRSRPTKATTAAGSRSGSKRKCCRSSRSNSPSKHLGRRARTDAEIVSTNLNPARRQSACCGRRRTGRRKGRRIRPGIA